MKRMTNTICTMLLIQSCGGVDQKKMIQEGRILVDANDCKTCHHPTNNIIGPAHLEVAKKYETTEENIQLLAERIIKGGSGVWGDIPMTAHTDLSEEDARKMARYVLSLDEQK
jgi:cytochrome c